MASSDTLREQAIAAYDAVDSALGCDVPALDAAIRVVLAAVAEQIEALDVAEQGRGRYFGGESQRVLREVRARVARLGGAVSDGE